MIPAENSYRQLRHTLEDLVRRQDRVLLRALLSGRELPALGQDLEPAQLLLRALETPSFDANLARRLAQLTTPLVSGLSAQAQAGGVAAGRTALPEHADADGTDRAEPAYLFNLFHLASRLPRDAGLFEALCGFFGSGHQAPALAADGGRPALQLRRALCNQQTDARLWDFWVGRLAERSGPWNDERRSELLEAWRGLLWCLDLTEEHQAAALERLDDALRVLHDRVAAEPRGDAVLKHALMRMEQAFPSAVGSPRLVRALRPHWKRWPRLLKDTALLVWPALAPRPIAEMPPLPPELAELWNALSRERQQTLLGFLRGTDTAGGSRFLNDLAFDPPQVPGAAPQQVRQRILELSHRLFPPDTAKQTEPPAPDPDDWSDEEHDAHREHAGYDREQALKRVNRTLRSIEQRLARGDLAKARVYLDQLVEQQRAQALPDTHVHLAKTLTNAATLARDHGLLDWAEALYRESMTENQKDPVAPSGLADVLKARGDLDAAEAQYRDNMARWPASRVACHGLANVLRKQGQVVAALALIDEPMNDLLTQSDIYDLHLRALLLMDLGRVEDARATLHKGMAGARAAALRTPFERALLLLDLPLKEYRAARRRLAAMPDNVVPLQLFRLHAAAGDGDEPAARELLAGLHAQIDRMSLEKREVLARLEEGFCLVGATGLCQPDDADLDAIFDAEVELELAA